MPQGNEQTVLLVDDDTDSRIIYGRVLTYAGYRVIGVPNGHEALEQTTAVCPDIILLDLGLPDMDGLDLVAALRARESTARAQIIILTAYVSDDDRSRARSAGCHTYLLKPVLPRDLLHVIQQRLESMPAPTSTMSGSPRNAARHRSAEPPRQPPALSLLLRPR
jgi:CheY-like chemotaxis protein